MKILIINWQDIKNPFGGGAEVHMHEIFKRIAAMGHQVTLLSCESEGLPHTEIIDGIEVIRKGSRNLFNFFVKGMYKELRKRNYDIVIDDINKIPFYTPLYVKEPLLAISHHFFGKSIFREAGLISGSYVFTAEMLVNKIYKNTPFAVVSESTLQEFLERGFNRRNFTIIYNAISPEEFPMEVSQKHEELSVIYFGRLKKYKSPDHLLKAFAAISGDFPEAKLYIMGRGDFQPHLEKLALELNISKNTKFLGYVSEEQKISHLSKCHIAVNTSMKEGWGITNIEANACGTPVVSANVPGLRDSVSDGKSGILYEYGNVGELASILSDLLSDNNKRELLSAGAVEWAKQFTWDESAKKMLELCEVVIENFKNKH